jgi:hypothetical protein
LQRLIKAALADEEGQALDEAIADLDASAGLQPASQRSVLSSGGSRRDERS